MAIHPDQKSMLYESLPEMILVAKYCIEYQKDTKTWPAPGCFGYPAALILLSAVDSIGSYVLGGKVKNHFKILADKDYYNLSLSDQEIDDLHNKYRNLLSHNTVLADGVMLNIGDIDDPVFSIEGDMKSLNLIPFYNLSVEVVKKFLDNADAILEDNQTMINISKK